MNPEDQLVGSDDVVAREVGGETVLLDLASGTYFGLDPVGSRVWDQICDEGATLAQLTDLIEREFEAPREQIVDDLQKLAAQLIEAGLVESHPASSD